MAAMAVVMPMPTKDYHYKALGAFIRPRDVLISQLAPMISLPSLIALIMVIIVVSLILAVSAGVWLSFPAPILLLIV